MRRTVKAVYFWVTAFTVTVFLYLWCALEQIPVILGLRPRDGRRHHRIASIWGRAMINIVPGWRVTIEGREHLPADLSHLPLVIVANHESMSDIWAMYYLGLPFRWLSKEEVFKVPFVGGAMRWAGYVPIRRGNSESHLEAMRISAEWLGRGVPMFFFPEGTRSRDGRIQPFKLGAFKLARDTGAAVLPVAIHGAGELMPKGSMFPSRTAHVRIRILPPVPAPAADCDLQAYADQVRATIVTAHSGLI